MNLHQIVASVVGVVNPLIPITVYVSSGSTTNRDGSRTPRYLSPITVMGQVQPETFRDIQQTASLNLQGTRKSIYLNGRIDGLVRADNKGGDLIILPDQSQWLVALVLEQWPDWCKVAAVLQRRSTNAPILGI